MLIEDFTRKYKFKGRDSQIALKIYSGQDKSESDWFSELKNKFDFKDIEKFKKIREVKKKFEEKTSENKRESVSKKNKKKK